VQSILGSLGQPTHDPEVLWKRAENLAAGTGVATLARARVLPAVLANALEPVLLTRSSTGMRLSAPGSEPLERMFGISHGDVVMAVNGYRSEAIAEAYTDVLRQGVAVVEVVRERRLVALRIEAAR
jgi:hypothetical protein